MKKYIALLCLFALLLTGCHGTVAPATEPVSSEQTPHPTDTFQVPDTFDTTKSHTITFWAKNDTNKTQVDVYKRAIEEFQALYPNVTVKLKLYTDYGRIYNDVITNIATNTTPNVCITYPDHIATYLSGEGTVVPLDTLFTDAHYGLGGDEVLFDAPTQDQIVPKFLQECSFGGHYYALPYMRSTEACYINKTFVEKLGYTIPEILTWDFIWEVSQAALKKDADGNYQVNGQSVLIPFIYKSTDNMMIQMLAQQNAGYSTADGQVLLFNEQSKAIMKTVASQTADGAFSTFKYVGYPANFLNAGQCIFAIDSTAGATWMGTDAPLVDISEDALVEFETVVRPIPQYDPENPKMISQGPSMCIFNKADPQEVLASWLFMQYLLTDSVQIPYAQTEGYVPVTTKAQESAVYLDYLSRSGEDNDLYYSIKLDATKLLLENMDNTFVTPVFNGSAAVRNAAGGLIEGIVKAVRKKDTVDDGYIEKINAETAALYRLDQMATVSSEPTQLGPLPTESVILLCTLACIWLIMGLCVLHNHKKRKK